MVCIGLIRQVAGGDIYTLVSLDRWRTSLERLYILYYFVVKDNIQDSLSVS